MRVFLLIMDGMGIGAAPDWCTFNDSPGATLQHIGAALHGIRVPHLGELGLGNLGEIAGVAPFSPPRAAHGSVVPITQGCDTYAGVMEMMGIIRSQRRAALPYGVPVTTLRELEELTGTSFLGNVCARGIDILKEFGPAHLATGRPIIYSAGDGVVLIVGHEDVIAPDALYSIGRTAITLLQKHDVARVIVRPFFGSFPAFGRRHELRKYFATDSEASTDTLLGLIIHDSTLPVIATEHISSLLGEQFCKRATILSRISGNRHQIDHALNLLMKDVGKRSLVIFCFQEFDECCHTKDFSRLRQRLEEFDAFVGELLCHGGAGDLFIITADHGNDPLVEKVGHTRELVPLLAFGGVVKNAASLGRRETLADIGATIAEVFGLGHPIHGRSFWHLLCG